MIFRKIILSTLLYKMAGLKNMLDKNVISPISKMALKFLPNNRETRIFFLLLVIVGLVMWYNRQHLPKLGMTNSRAAAPTKEAGAAAGTGGVKPIQTSPDEQYTKVQGVATDTHGLAPSCSGSAKIDPADLLPKDKNSEWAKLNPHGAGELTDVNLLKSGHHIGVNTVGNTMRNANLQVRSEPPNPQGGVGPWNQTTMEPDLQRKTME
jgi:hypothetical protein